MKVSLVASKSPQTEILFKDFIDGQVFKPKDSKSIYRKVASELAVNLNTMSVDYFDLESVCYIVHCGIKTNVNIDNGLLHFEEIGNNKHFEWRGESFIKYCGDHALNVNTLVMHFFKQLSKVKPIKIKAVHTNVEFYGDL